MESIDRIINVFIRIVRNICSVLLGLMLLITSLHVLFRYVFKNPLIWSQEISLLLLIWFGFFSISNELYSGNHMAIEMFYNKFSPSTKKVADTIRYFVVTVFCLFMAYYLVVISESILGGILPVSGLPKVIMYIPVLISSILMLLYSIVLLIKSVKENYFSKGEV